MDDATYRALRVDHAEQEGTELQEDGSKHVTHYCAIDDEDYPCRVAQALDTIDTLRAENERLEERLKDALITLQPFVDVSLPGYDAASTRPRTVTVTEGDLCQAWQVVTQGQRWRPAKTDLCL